MLRCENLVFPSPTRSSMQCYSSRLWDDTHESSDHQTHVGPYGMERETFEPRLQRVHVRADQHIVMTAGHVRMVRRYVTLVWTQINSKALYVC